MKQFVALVSILLNLYTPIAAQLNWAAIPCSKMKQLDAINKMFVDSLHNEIICCSVKGYSVCNTTYKGLFAFNNSGFHDLDKGIETHDGLNPATNGPIVNGCIRFGDKTLFGGGFFSVGTNTLFAKSIALWNGSSWSNFPSPVFDNTPNWNTGGGFQGFIRWNGLLYLYGGFNSIGNTVTQNLAAYDGNTFTAVPSIPISNYSPIIKMSVYKNKLIAMGNFYNAPSFDYFRLAQFDGTAWAPVGNGARGSVVNVTDMKVYNDTLYIAGNFSKSSGNAGNYLMKWDGNQLLDAGFGDWCGYGPIYSLVPFRGKLYAFGGFTCAAGQKAFGVAYYENGSWTVPQDSIEGPTIFGAVVYNDQIYIGGGFRSINGDTTKQNFAKLMCPDFDAASGCISGFKESTKIVDAKIFPNPTSDEVYIETGQGLTLEKIVLVNILGQTVLDVKSDTNRQLLDVREFPQGVYFIRTYTSQGQGMLKLVKK